MGFGWQAVHGGTLASGAARYFWGIRVWFSIGGGGWIGGVDGEKEINQQDVSKDCEWQVDEAKEPNQQWGGGKRCRWQCGCCPRSPKGYGCRQCCRYVAEATAVESRKGGARRSGKRGSGDGWGGGGGDGHNGGHGGSQGGGKGGDGDHHGGGKGGDSGSQQGEGDHKGGGGGGKGGGVGGDKGRRTLKMFIGEGKVVLTLKKLKALGKNKISV